ncbi:MAG: chromate efflux transporter [Oceanicaulis sp.]
MPRGSVFEVYATFLRLGLIAFGGPAAHLALFRTVFTEKLGWLSAQRYDSLMALCQFLPGPGSSQTAAAIGHERAGRAGALAAMIGFATPSLVLMGLAGWGVGAFAALIGSGVIGGLLAAAAAVVANAVLSMARTQAASPAGAAIAILAFAAVLGASLAPVPLTAVQPLVIALGGLAGLALMRPGAPPRGAAMDGAGWGQAAAWFALFAVLLAGLPLLAGSGEAARLADTVYRAGALVFGGGHVVLPLLEAGAVPELVDEDRFLAGYGLAQAIPGPLFTFAAYLGAAAAETPLEAAAYALLAGLTIFAPGLFLVYAALPVWSRLERLAWARAAISGAAAAVTGVLGAALIDPVLLSVPRTPAAYAILAAAFAALRWGKVPPPFVIGLAGAAGWVLL